MTNISQKTPDDDPHNTKTPDDDQHITKNTRR